MAGKGSLTLERIQLANKIVSRCDFLFWKFYIEVIIDLFVSGAAFSYKSCYKSSRSCYKSNTRTRGNRKSSSIYMACQIKPPSWKHFHLEGRCRIMWTTCWFSALLIIGWWLIARLSDVNQSSILSAELRQGATSLQVQTGTLNCFLFIYLFFISFVPSL